VKFSQAGATSTGLTFSFYLKRTQYAARSRTTIVGPIADGFEKVSTLRKHNIRPVWKWEGRHITADDCNDDVWL